MSDMPLGEYAKQWAPTPSGKTMWCGAKAEVVIARHTRVVCHDECEGCQFCQGGLFACACCDSYEGATTTDCPGAPMTEGQRDAVYAGSLDFEGGEWVLQSGPFTPNQLFPRTAARVEARRVDPRTGIAEAMCPPVRDALALKSHYWMGNCGGEGGVDFGAKITESRPGQFVAPPQSFRATCLLAGHDHEIAMHSVSGAEYEAWKAEQDEDEPAASEAEQDEGWRL